MMRGNYAAHSTGQQFPRLEWKAREERDMRADAAAPPARARPRPRARGVITVIWKYLLIVIKRGLGSDF